MGITSQKNKKVKLIPNFDCEKIDKVHGLFYKAVCEIKVVHTGEKLLTWARKFCAFIQYIDLSSETFSWWQNNHLAITNTFLPLHSEITFDCKIVPQEHVKKVQINAQKSRGKNYNLQLSSVTRLWLHKENQGWF